MRISVLHEEAEHKPQISITRAKKDFSQINGLNRKTSKLELLNHIVATAKHNGKVVGYAIAKPYTKVAYNRCSGVHPDFEQTDLLHDLTKFLVDWCKQSGFEYHTARSEESGSDLYSSVYGEPIKNRAYKHKSVNMFRTDLSGSNGPAATRTPSRAGARLRSDRV